MFEKAIKWRWVTSNPVSASDEPEPANRDEIILTDDEYQRLLTECEPDPMLFMWVLTCGETGMRSRSEALHLRWEDVDFSDGFIWIDSTRHGRRTKIGKGRWVPMTPRLREAMQAHFAMYRFGGHLPSPSPWIFHRLTSRGGTKPGNRIEEIRTPWYKAIKRANLPDGFRMHDLRHRRITTWIAEGKPVTLVKEAVGHSALATTMHYTHLAKNHLRTLVEDDQDERARLKELAK
jgi:integrase